MNMVLDYTPDEGNIFIENNLVEISSPVPHNRLELEWFCILNNKKYDCC